MSIKQSWLLFLVLGQISSPVFAAETTVTANCIWKGNDGEVVNQSCRISGNSDHQKRSEIKIIWKDGYKTIAQRRGLHSFSSPAGTPIRIAKPFIPRQHKSSFRFPQEFYIKDDGVILIQYLELPHFVEITARKNLQVANPFSEYAQTEYSDVYKRNNLSSESFKQVKSRIPRFDARRFPVTKAYSFGFKNLTLVYEGGHPARFITQVYQNPISRQEAIFNASIIAPEVNFNEAMILQENNSLYSAKPFFVGVILNSCLLSHDTLGKVTKTECIFSTP